MTERTLSAAVPRTELIASFEAAKRRAPFALGYTDGFFISQADRDKAAKSGAAMPDGSYPITTCDGDNSVATAIHAVGRGGADHDAIRRHIIKRAKSLGCSSKIPDNWNADGSLQAASTVRRALAIIHAHFMAAFADTEPSPADADVTKGVGQLQDLVAQLQKTQASDPDDATDPNDQKVTDLLNQVDALVNELAKAQSIDVAGATTAPESSTEPDGTTVTPTKPKGAPEPPKPVAAAKLAKQEPINPADTEGNVDPDAVCATDGCGHVAAVHEDTQTGENTGACTTPNCDCTAMTFATNEGDAVQGDDGTVEDDATGGPNNAGGEDAPAPAPAKMASMFAAPAVADAPTAPDASADAGGDIAPADSTINEAPVVEGAAVMGPAFVIPCGIIEGQETDDGRSLATNSLAWLNPPFPLMGQATATHDPAGMDLNAPAVLCGRIDSIERVPGENGTMIIAAKGYFLPDDDGLYYAEKVAAMGRVGISADVKVFETAITAGELDEYGFPESMTEVVTSGEVAGFTIVPGPAFPQCYIALDDGTDAPAPTIKTDEQSPMAASGQLVHFMAAEPCEPCEAMDVIDEAEAIVAGGFVAAPLRPPKAWFGDPNFTVGDGRLVEIFTGRGETRLGGRYACPLTITDEGEVFGHIAPWDVCHTGQKGKCVTAPHSRMGYAQFMRAGQQVVTAEGERVTVGVLTFDTSHADLNARLANSDVQRHYDHTGTAWADVVAGEDEFGVWVHGAIRPNLTEAKLRAIRAASPSGDWRECGGHLELMAVLQVNQPGFPVAMVAGGSTKALVAAGAATMLRLSQPVPDDDPEDRDLLLRLATKPLRRLVASDAQQRLSALRDDAKADALTRLARL